MQKIDCPWCGAKVDNRLDKLAEHIFKAHGDDVGLCTWARAELVKIGKSPDSIKPKYRGKPLDRIPPKRQWKLPKYLRKQLPGQNKER